MHGRAFPHTRHYDESIAHEGPVLDLYPAGPLHESGQENHTVTRGLYYGPPIPTHTCYQRVTRKLVPLWHLSRTGFDWTGALRLNGFARKDLSLLTSVVSCGL